MVVLSQREKYAGMHFRVIVAYDSKIIEIEKQKGVKYGCVWVNTQFLLDRCVTYWCLTLV